MRQALKQLLKTVLPGSFLRAAVDARDALRLAATPRQNFDAANLRSIATHDLDSAFHSPAIEVTWRSDHAALKGLVGDDDKSGAINPGDRRAVYYLVRALEPQNVLEIGTHIGASTLAIGRALRSNGKGGKVTTVDILDVNQADGPWKQAGLPMSPRELAAALDCGECIRFAVSPSLEFLRAAHEKFDFIFLDGDHGARAVYLEMAAALRVLNPGGAILLHDYYPSGKALFPDDNVIRGPYRALARIARESPDFNVLPLGNLPWPTKQGVNATSLAVVTRSEE